MSRAAAPTTPALPCIYEVTIGHARRAPVEHRFRHRTYMWLFDRDEPPRLPGPLRALAAYRTADHVDVGALLRQHGIEATRILVLANLRVLGYVFNPITVYWCYDAGGRLVAHVAEVHNTYGGRHAYVLPTAGPQPDGAVVAKAMYVSPFHPVDGSYRLVIGAPGDRLSVSVALERPGQPAFRAGISGRRRRADTVGVLRHLVRYPIAPLRARVLIQLEGLRLWWRGLEVQPR